MRQMKAYGDFEGVNLTTGEKSQRCTGDGESKRVVNRGSVDVSRLGPGSEIVFGPREDEPTVEDIARHVKGILNQRRSVMHYRNGREAKNGDKIVQIGGYGSSPEITAVGVLYGAKPGNDHCNGQIAPIQAVGTSACLCDCLHVDDVAAMLAEKGLDKRPEGK